MAREFEQLDAQGYPLPQASPPAGLQTAGLGTEVLKGLIPRLVRRGAEDLVPGFDSVKAIIQAIQDRYGARGVGKAAVGAGAVGAGAVLAPGVSPLIRAIQGPPSEPEQFVDEVTARAAKPSEFVDEATARAALPRGAVPSVGGAQPVPVTAVSDPNERVKAAFGAFPAVGPPPQAEPPDLRTAILNHLLTTPAR